MSPPATVGTAAPPSTARSSSRSAARTAATAAAAATSILVVDPQTSPRCSTTTTARTARPATASPARAPPHGADGGDLELPGPRRHGRQTADGEVLADLVGVGTRFVAAAGGRGGLGNAALASPRRKAPGFALLGEPGDALRHRPRAQDHRRRRPGRLPQRRQVLAWSRRISAARPKIADYPFTTLVPNLGVVEAGEARYTVADVPGLIPGAARAGASGLDFLRHVERCAVLLHVLDCATLEPGRDPSATSTSSRPSWAAYGGARRWPLLDRPRLVALNKIDVPEAASSPSWSGPTSRSGACRSSRSRAATHEGLRELTFALAEVVAAEPRRRCRRRADRIVLRPRAGRRRRLHGRRRAGDGALPSSAATSRERWVRQTDFTNDEAVGYLADRLARLGVEEALAAAGADRRRRGRRSATRRRVVFDWEPTLRSGLLAARGADRA